MSFIDKFSDNIKKNKPVVKVKKDKLKKSINSKMTGKIKVFNEELHSKFDIEARDVIKARFPDCVCDNEDKYGEDLVCITKELPYKFIEVQVYGDWVKKFPYKSPFIYERKMRFDQKTLFIGFNYNYSQAVIFSKKVVDEEPSKLKKYARECVHFAPWSRSMIVDIEDLTLENIKSYAGV